MERLNKIVLVLIFMCAALKWSFYFGFRVNYFEVLIFLFMITFTFTCLRKGSVKMLNHNLKAYILFLWIGIGIVILSGLAVIFNPVAEGQVLFHLKAVLQNFVWTIFFSLLILYLSNISQSDRAKLLNWFFVGVLFSSAYAILQLWLISRYGFDMDAEISRVLPYSRTDEGFFITLERYAYGTSYRVNGLTGDPSVHAQYALIAAPFFLVRCFTERGGKNVGYFLMILISVIVTMSISGIIGLLFALLTLCILYRERFGIRAVIALLGIFFVSSVCFMYFKESVVTFFDIRTDPTGSGQHHLELLKQSLEMASSSYFLGIGYNMFSGVYASTFGEARIYNPHNSWVIPLVELGIIGFAYKLLFCWWIFKKSLPIKTLSSFAFIAAFIGMAAAAMGYQTLELFHSQLFITICFANLMLDNGEDAVFMRTAEPNARLAHG